MRRRYRRSWLHRYPFLVAFLAIADMGYAWGQTLPPASSFQGDLRRSPSGEIIVVPQQAPPPTSRGSGAKEPISPPIPAQSAVPGLAEEPSKSDAGTPPVVPVIANVSNAPIWRPATAYSAPVPPTRFGSRVNSGPGTMGGTYTSGSVYVWAALNNGTSASGGNGPQSCPTPGESIYSESTGIQWKCLGVIDYVTFSSWAFDAPAYNPTPSTAYFNKQYVKNGAGLVYRQSPLIGCGSSGNCNCVSAGSAPSGTGPQYQQDGTCYWTYAATIPYWSGHNGPIPHQYYASGNYNGGPSTFLTRGYIAYFFHGGTEQPNYAAGINNETIPLTLQAHFDCTDDSGTSTESCPNPISHLIEALCAPVDCRASVNVPLAYDETQFVSFYNNQTYAYGTIPTGGSGGYALHLASVISQQDSGFLIKGIALKSENGEGITGNRPNALYALNILIDAAGPLGIYTDAASAVVNSVLIVRGSTTAEGVIGCSYGCLLDNDTFYMPNGGTNSTCIEWNSTNTLSGNPFSGPSPYWSNLAVFGCQFFAGNGAGGIMSNNNQFNNVTSASTAPNQTSFNMAYQPTFGIRTIVPPAVGGSACGGPCYGLSFANEFVGASDLRLKATAAEIGAGAAFTSSSFAYAPTLTNATDFFGAARPTGSTYNPGAAQVAYPHP
jgi:hypothetical protein